MDEPSPRKSLHHLHHRHHWRRDAVELAAVFIAASVADLAGTLIAHGPEGPVLLIVSAVALLFAVGFHSWWARRHAHSPPGPDTAAAGASAAEPDPMRAAAADSTLWRLRTTVRDAPGSLAALCGALASAHVDILTLQTHPLSDDAIDEFLIRAPVTLTPQQLMRVVGSAGGRDTWLERADAHELVDTQTRVLDLAARTALDAAELPLTLRQLLGRCTIRSRPADGDRVPPPEGTLQGTVIQLRDLSGGTIIIERPYLPFTPTEFARARALVALDARLGPRVPHRRDVLTLPEGKEISVRRAGPRDLPAARAMHDRCSRATLLSRYHGPANDADHYLRHLLSPQHGCTLAVETTSGKLVALGHLLWDGDESEIALLVEDDWQSRGIGGELLRRLVSLAQEAGCPSIYAVTRSGNTAMVAAMRGLGLPLDYQVEAATLVITATLREHDGLQARPAHEAAHEGRPS